MTKVPTDTEREEVGWWLDLVILEVFSNLNNSAILGSREKAKSISDYSHGHEVSAQTSTSGGKFSSVKMWPPECNQSMNPNVSLQPAAGIADKRSHVL